MLWSCSWVCKCVNSFLLVGQFIPYMLMHNNCNVVPKYWYWVSHCMCSMGFLKNPQAFLRLLQTVMEITGYRFILFTAGYMPLDTAVRAIVAESSSYVMHKQFNDECLSLFNDRLFCFSGWAFQANFCRMCCDRQMTFLS